VHTQRKLSDYPTDEISNVSEAVSSKLGRNLHLKRNHPICIIKERIFDFFTNPNSKLQSPIKYKTFDSISPLVTVEQNFDSLLFPKDHEGRKATDTYYINKGNVLRTHTSAHQSELMKGGNMAFLVCGDVYRRDAIDATHYPVFHQMEGVKVFTKEELSGKSHDEQVKIIENDLKNTLTKMVDAVFGMNLQSKWVDAYFPFTHPSWEYEIFFAEKWMEVLGSGVIQQGILANSGLGDRKGWAFGLGLERLAMILFDIPDIRLFWSEDGRFTSQFEAGKISKFKPYSKFPACYKDITFWVPPEFHENNLFEFVRGKLGDIAESVSLVDTFKHPKNGKESRCYRINYRHMDRNLTNEEVNDLQQNILKELPTQLKVQIR